MKTSICLKLILIFIVLTTCFFLQTAPTYATWKNIIGAGDNFISMGSQTDAPIEDIRPISNSIYNTLLILGVTIAVIVGAVLGIKFITGSIEQKSKIKESLIPYFVGCFVIFGAFAIWKIAIVIFRVMS